MRKTLKYGMLLLLLIAQLFIVQSVIAFEGDYIWEERFQASLFKAKDGDAKAQLAVGDMYHMGRGIKVDDEQALHWFLLSASQGNLKAAYKAAYIYLHSDAVTRSPEAALPLLRKAIGTNYPPAQYELGLLYGTGRAGQWNSTRALTLLAKAKLAGYKPANAAFDQVVRRLVKSNTRPSRKKSVQASLQPKSNAGPILKPVALPKATKVRLSPKITPRLAKRHDPRRMILASRWNGHNGPSTFLPSQLTDCREKGEHIECMSSELTKQVANAEVVYRIRTKITDIQKDGRFRLAYANNVLSATNDTGTIAMRIKTGWQSNEHYLDCSLAASETISCSQGARQYRFTAR